MAQACLGLAALHIALTAARARRRRSAWHWRPGDTYCDIACCLRLHIQGCLAHYHLVSAVCNLHLVRQSSKHMHRSSSSPRFVGITFGQTNTNAPGAVKPVLARWVHFSNSTDHFLLVSRYGLSFSQIDGSQIAVSTANVANKTLGRPCVRCWLAWGSTCLWSLLVREIDVGQTGRSIMESLLACAVWRTIDPDRLTSWTPDKAHGVALPCESVSAAQLPPAHTIFQQHF